MVSTPSQMFTSGGIGKKSSRLVSLQRHPQCTRKAQSSDGSSHNKDYTVKGCSSLWTLSAGLVDVITLKCITTAQTHCPIPLKAVSVNGRAISSLSGC